MNILASACINIVRSQVCMTHTAWRQCKMIIFPIQNSPALCSLHFFPIDDHITVITHNHRITWIFVPSIVRVLTPLTLLIFSAYSVCDYSLEERNGLSWVTRTVFSHIHGRPIYSIWTNVVIVFTDVWEERFFYITCHSAQRDERQGPVDVRQYNQQDKRSTDKHSVQQLC